MISLLGLYRPRRTPMHLTPAWAKMLFLLVITVSCMVISDPVTSIGITAACLLLLASTKPPLKATLKGMTVITIMAALTAAFQLWLGDYVRALDLAGDLISISALALAVTSSTSMEAMLDLVTALARPLRWILPPETLGLMVALGLRAIPEAARIIVEARIAARARGMDRSLRAVVIPSASRTVGFALQLGQALHARGIAEHGRTRTIEREVAESDIRHDALRARGMAAPPVREVESEPEQTAEPPRPRARRKDRRRAATPSTAPGDEARVMEAPDLTATEAADLTPDEETPDTAATPDEETPDTAANPDEPIAADTEPPAAERPAFDEVIGFTPRRERRRGLR